MIETNSYSYNFASFYNRDKEIEQTLDMLDKKQCVSIVGPRKIGKTWFLRHISQPSILREHGIDPQHNVCVSINCQPFSIQQNEDQVHNKILQDIISAAQRTGVDFVSEPRGGHTAETSLEQALKKIHSHGLRTILFLDGFDVMTRNPNLDASFFNHLRALTNADDVNVAYVTASRASLVDLWLAHRYQSSSFFNIFQTIRLGLFNEQHSQRLLKACLRRTGTSLPKDLLALVLELSGGHPFLLQMAGYHAPELQAAKTALLASQDLAAIPHTMRRQIEFHFEHHWKQLNSREQHVLATLPLTLNEERHREELETLARSCLIVKKDGRYKYFSPLLHNFVQRQNETTSRQKLELGPIQPHFPLARRQTSEIVPYSAGQAPR